MRFYCKHGEPIPIESAEEQFIGWLSMALEPA